MSSEKRCSIIIINYNTFELTSKCIASIYRHEQALDYQIILLDNNSSECDPKEFKKRYKDIVLIEAQQNLGFSKGVNRALKEVKTPFFLLLNSDAVLKNNAISIALKEFEESEDLAVVSVGIENQDQELQKQANRFAHIARRLFELSRMHKLFSNRFRAQMLMGIYFDHKVRIEPDYVWGTFMLMRRDLIAQLANKKLDDDYFMYFEDVQWCKDFKDMGYKIVYQPKGRVMHLDGKSSTSEHKMKLLEKSKTIFLKKNYGYLHQWALKLSGY